MRHPCIIMGLFGMLSAVANANTPSPQEIARENLGKQQGIYSISSEYCSLKIEEVGKFETPGNYRSWFKRPGHYTAVSTALSDRWTINSEQATLTYTHIKKNILARFYFDDTLKIYQYEVDGDSRGICKLE